MTHDERCQLGRAIAFAMRDGRLAREAGQPIAANPHTAIKLSSAWAEGWCHADKVGDAVNAERLRRRMLR